MRDGIETAIGLAGPADAGDVADLLVAMDDHYLGPGRGRGPEAALAMVRSVMDSAEGTRFALARAAGRPSGLACFVHVRPGHLFQGVLWVKDLYVAAPQRGGGLGRRLMAWLAAHARAHGLGRIDLTTEPDNEAAQAFYERLGGTVRPKVFYRFDDDVLRRLAAGGDAEPGGQA